MPRFFRIFRKKLRLRARRQYLLARAIRRGRGLKPVQDRTRRIRPGDILLFMVLRNEKIRLPFFLDNYRRMGSSTSWSWTTARTTADANT